MGFLQFPISGETKYFFHVQNRSRPWSEHDNYREFQFLSISWNETLSILAQKSSESKAKISRYFRTKKSQDISEPKAKISRHSRTQYFLKIDCFQMSHLIEIRSASKCQLITKNRYHISIKSNIAFLFWKI